MTQVIRQYKYLHYCKIKYIYPNIDTAKMYLKSSRWRSRGFFSNNFAMKYYGTDEYFRQFKNKKLYTKIHA